MIQELIDTKEVFELANMIDYVSGEATRKPIVENEHMRVVLRSFEGGASTGAHPAPGDLIIFALEGKGIVTYEDKDFEILPGQNFRFTKGEMHSVRGADNFKMALVIILND